MTWTETYYGKRFELADPHPDRVDLRDIAHSLARTNRFTGHTSRCYSVAEHSLHCVTLLESAPLRISAPFLLAHTLFHDSEEYVLGDISAPLKELLRQGHQYSFLDELAQRIRAVIHVAVGLPPVDAAGPGTKRLIKHTDLRMQMTERAVLMPHTGEHQWASDVEPDPNMMAVLRLAHWECATEEDIERRFLAKATELLAQVKGLGSA